MAAIPLIYIGSLMDRLGLRVTMLGATVLFGGSCLLASQVSNWATLVGAFFMLRLLGPGALAFVSGNALSYWFHRRLGMAEGLRNLARIIHGLNNHHRKLLRI